MISTSIYLIFVFTCYCRPTIRILVQILMNALTLLSLQQSIVLGLLRQVVGRHLTLIQLFQKGCHMKEYRPTKWKLKNFLFLKICYASRSMSNKRISFLFFSVLCSLSPLWPQTEKLWHIEQQQTHTG